MLFFCCCCKQITKTTDVFALTKLIVSNRLQAQNTLTLHPARHCYCCLTQPSHSRHTQKHDKNTNKRDWGKQRSEWAEVSRTANGVFSDRAYLGHAHPGKLVISLTYNKQTNKPKTQLRIKAVVWPLIVYNKQAKIHRTTFYKLPNRKKTAFEETTETSRDDIKVSREQ